MSISCFTCNEKKVVERLDNVMCGFELQRSEFGVLKKETARDSNSADERT